MGPHGNQVLAGTGDTGGPACTAALTANDEYVEAISNKQGELDNYIAEGYKNALSEERRRYCFLWTVSCHRQEQLCLPHQGEKDSAILLCSSVGDGRSFYPRRFQCGTSMCGAHKLPDRAMFLAQQMSGAAGIMPPGAHHPGMPISEPIPGAKPLPVPPELAALRASGGMGQQRLMGSVEGGMAVMNGTAGAHGGEDYQQWVEARLKFVHVGLPAVTLMIIMFTEQPRHAVHRARAAAAPLLGMQGIVTACRALDHRDKSSDFPPVHRPCGIPGSDVQSAPQTGFARLSRGLPALSDR
ncbi:Brain-specific angiogenesis inhibitor 1-associated protein 2 [Collichthys lucidus]|uniref:Brain-specific angiogenesis inhibitor 1-associated protein 2 n=1 Tax=Collichthys lucidus TaxID=240159 RepID=A0A4U5VLX9_COLLU|nr:Brain-specific angiogenesis inhibitor 1-associated protein 2 [Collichthys lucidus]